MIYDCLIIGSGPAGLTAALYAKRAGLNTIILEKIYVGGQIVNTLEVDNYPGFPEISGDELMEKFESHVKNHLQDFSQDDVLEIEVKKPFLVKGKKNNYEAKTIIIATGAQPQKLNVKGEETFKGKGVSYCATCDGAFYRNKTCVVLGSGNTAVEDAVFLARICKKVYLVSRSDKFKAEAKVFGAIKAFNNVELIYNHTAKEIKGQHFVSQIEFVNTKTNEPRVIDTDGIFVAIGVKPNTNLLDNMAKKTNQGYFITNDKMMTSIEGIYAIGDARDTPLRQVITAASDGAIAAFYASVSLVF